MTLPPVPPIFNVDAVSSFVHGAKKTLTFARDRFFTDAPTLKRGGRGASIANARLVGVSVFFALTGTMLMIR